MIDTHVHLTGSALFPDRLEILKRCTLSKVQALVNICLSGQELRRIKELTSDHVQIVHAAAIHPTEQRFDASYFDEIARLAQKRELVAIGETGLDYKRSPLDPKAQAERFEQHMQLALQNKLPLIIHCREAFKDLIDQLRCHYLHDSRAVPGLLHCFSEGPEELAQLVEMGWSVGFGGLVTYDKAASVQRAAAIAPSHSFVLETDSPFLSPEPHRNERNEPALVPLIAKHLANLRGELVEILIERSSRNARQLFKL